MGRDRGFRLRVSGLGVWGLGLGAWGVLAGPGLGLHGGACENRSFCNQPYARNPGANSVFPNSNTGP